jgi:ribose transport system substrate-binding protein
MKLIRILIAMLAVASVAVSSVFAGGGQDPKAAKKPVFVMVPKGVHPYYEPCFEGFEAAAKKYGVEVEMVTPPKFELAVQVKVIEDLIARKVDGITISALDDAGLVSVVNEATQAGIKVITFDAPASSTSALT